MGYDAVLVIACQSLMHYDDRLTHHMDLITGLLPSFASRRLERKVPRQSKTN